MERNEKTYLNYYVHVLNVNMLYTKDGIIYGKVTNLCGNYYVPCSRSEDLIYERCNFFYGKG